MHIPTYCPRCGDRTIAPGPCKACSALFEQLIGLCAVAAHTRGIAFPNGDVDVEGTRQGPVTVRAGNLTFLCVQEADNELMWHIWLHHKGVSTPCLN